MEISIANQLLTIFNSFFLGFLACLIYQAFKLLELPIIKEYSSKFVEKMKDKTYGALENPLNEKTKHKTFRIVIQSLFDFLYFVFLAPIYAIFFYETSDGIVRWYVFIFSMIGFLIFQFTVGKILRRVIEYLGFYLEIAFSYIIYKIKTIARRIFKKKTRDRKKKEEKRQVLISFGK